jgi:hypothetical protein
MSSLLQGDFSSPVGGYVAAVVRVLTLIVLPLCALGFLWGWSEKIELRRRLARRNRDPSHAINGWILRQTGMAMTCGVMFGLFTYASGLFRTFQPWEDVAAVRDNIMGVIAFAIVAAPVGTLVGAFSRRNLRRHLSSYDLQEAAE